MMEQESRTLMRVRKSPMRIGGSLLAVSAALLWAPPSWAQSAQNDGQTDVGGSANETTIVVTARKRDENVQSVPISITVFSQKEIEDKRLTDIGALEANTPGFTFDYLGGTKARPTIRGVGSDEPGAGGDASSVVFLDGVYQGRQGMAAVDIFDVRQIDVLRGPQGTLWGKNVVGGAINFVTNKPTRDFGGQVSMTAGTHGTIDAVGVVNLPISNTLRSRFAVSYKSNTGFVDNLYTGNKVNDTNRISLRGHLLYDPASAFTLLLTADYTRDKSSGLPVIVTRSNGGADAAVDANGPFETQAGIDGFARRKMYGLRAEMNLDIGFATLTNITAYRNLNDGTLEDWDGTNVADFPTVPQITFEFGDDSTSFSNETRLSRDSDSLKWVVGLYYLREKTNATAALGLGASQFNWTNSNVTNSFAAFGEATLAVTDRLNLTGGVRYTDEKKDYRNILVSGGAMQVYDTDALVAANPALDTTPHFDNVTWRLGLDYSASDHLFLYALASTGFKSGAFDSLAFSGVQAARTLNPEKLDNYEAGFKSTLPNGWGTFNVTAFYSNYKDLQLVQFTGVGTPGGLNIPSAKIFGIETEASLKFGANTGLDIKYAYLDTDAQSPENGVIVSGRRLIRTAKHDVSASLYQTVPLANGSKIDLGASYSYRSLVYDDPDNNNLEVRPARSLFDAFANWTSANEKIRASVWVKNITNEDYVVRVSNIANFNQVVVGPPRTAGITLTAFFD
jgi:iron complex outermembrane recepter protein